MPLLLELWERGYEIGEEAARQASGYKGFARGVQALIDSQGYAWLNQIIATLLDTLGDILGEHAEDDISAADLGALLEDALASEANAERIAQTEVTRASAQAAADVYQAAGIYEVRWVTEDDLACPECLANQAAGPLVYGNPFPSGDISPPAHPHCRCALLPYRRTS